jgi:sugar phosphate permease
MWGMMATAFLTVIFHRSALAVVLDYLIRDFQITDAAVAGALVGMYATMYMIMQIPGGLLADFWGPRKTVTAGMLVACAGSLIFASAPTLFMAFLGRGLVGLGVSVVFVSILKFQITWFKPTQFATISGLTGLTGNLGGIMATTPLAFLVTATGWRNSFFIVAAATFCIALLCWLVIRDSQEHLTGSYQADETKKKASIQGIAEALQVVFVNKNMWFLFFTSFGLAGCLMAFSGSWSIPYLMQVYGFSRTHSANFMLAVILGKVVGFPLIGYLSDRFVRRKAPLLIFFSIHILLWAVFWSMGKPPANVLMAIFFFMGLSSGALMLIITLAKEANQPAYAGTAMSVVNIAPFLGVSCIQPLLGYALELRWAGLITLGAKVYPLAAYRLLFAACLTVLLISFCFALQIKEAK